MGNGLGEGCLLSRETWEAELMSTSYAARHCCQYYRQFPISDTQPRKQGQQSIGKRARLHGGLTLSIRYRREWY